MKLPSEFLEVSFDFLKYFVKNDIPLQSSKNYFGVLSHVFLGTAYKNNRLSFIPILKHQFSTHK